MVWALRICLGLLVLAYAAWLAWPVADLLAGGVDLAEVWRLAGGGAGIAATADVAVWIAVILLYALSGLSTGAGLYWAPGAYFLAFAGEVLLSVRDPGPALIDIAARSAEGLRQAGLIVDPAPLAIAGLLVAGLLIVAVGAWRGQKGVSWTEGPAWG
jgi:hypothetical protein